MPDMLVPLAKIPVIKPLLSSLREENITIRRPNPWEREKLVEFICQHFDKNWSLEAQAAFIHQPITCFIALKDNSEIIGFACYECTRKDFFGPTGVNDDYRGKGIGKALYLASLHGLQDLGYAYAIIGSAGPVDFYKKCSDAMVIPMDEGKGIYHLDEDPKFRSM